METANDLLISLYRRDVRVYSKGGRLSVLASGTALLDEDKEKLRNREQELLELLSRMDVSKRVRVAPRPDGCTIPLVPDQLAYLKQLMEHSGGVSIRRSSFGVKIVGPLKAESLRAAIGTLVQTHEALRMRIVLVDSQPRQEVLQNPHYDWVDIDLTDMPSVSADAEVRRVWEDIFRVGHDILGEPYFAVTLIKLCAREHILVLALDHMITDGASNRILIEDLWHLYRQASRGVTPSIPKPAVQYGDYAVWLQHSYGAWLQTHESYWKNRLKGVPLTRVPDSNRLSDAINTTQEISLGRALSDGLRRVSRQQRALLAMTLLAVHALIMSRWCAEEDLLIAIPSTGRYGADVSRTIGFMAHHLYLRVQLRDVRTFADLLIRVTEEFKKALLHPTFGWVSPFEARGSVELWFNWSPTNAAESIADSSFGEGEEKVVLSPLRLWPVLRSKFFPQFYETANGICVLVTYRPDLHQSVAKFERTLRAVAERVISDAGWRLDSLNLDSLNIE